MFYKQILFFILMISVISCQKKTHQYQSHQVFRYNEHTNISSLDPAFAKNPANIWAVNQLFEGLVQLNDSLQVQPAIAKSWKISQQNKKYEFILRDDVYFHQHKLFGVDSTRVVTAYDFEYSFDRLLSPQVAAPGKWVLQNVESYKAVNDSVFNMTLKQSFPPFLSLLAMKYCSVVPKEIVNHYGTEFRSHPIGTGPFYFKLWKENTKLVFRKNQKYYEKDERGEPLPYLEAVAITFLADKQSEFLQFLQGNIDLLSGLDASFKDELLDKQGALLPKYQETMVFDKIPYLNTEYLGVFMEGETTENNDLLRKAFLIGFDRIKMLRYLRNNIGVPALGGFIPKGLPGYATNLISYQPEKAKGLVKVYKEQTGNEQPVIHIGTNANYLDVCEFIQRELQGIGLQVKIDILQSANLRQLKANGKLPVFRASWVADYPDAENYLSLFYSKNFTPNGPNYTHFKDDQFDQWYEQCLTIEDVKDRVDLYQKMDSLIMHNAPVIPLYYDEVVRFTSKKTKGFTANAINLLNLKKVSKLP